MTGVQVRPLTDADVAVLVDLERELFSAGAWSQASLMAELSGPGRWYIGAQDEVTGEVMGYAGLWFDGEDAQIMTLGTRTSRQRHGVGRVLLDALLARAQDLGARSMFLEVRVDNEAALELYRTAGFEQLGLRKRYYQPENVDAWTMRRSLHSRPGAG